MVATTAVDLCSQAYRLIGLESLNALDGTSPKGAIAVDLYDTVIEGLTTHPWRFMTLQAKLTRLAEAPTAQWKYFYQFPSGMLGTLWTLYDSNAVGAMPLKDFDVFGQKIAANVEDVWMEYRGLPAVSLWPPYFKQLAVYALAAHFAEAATDQSTKAEYWHRIAFGGPEFNGKGGYYATARAADSQGHPPPQQRHHPFIDVRG